MTPVRTSLVLAALASLAACKKDAPPPPPPAVPPAAVQPAGAIPGAPALPLGGAGEAAAPAPGGALTGVVAERLDAPNYTYLRIKSDQGDTWAAVPTNQLAVGTRVRITNPMPMQNFESKTLGRTFDVVMFGGAAEVLGEGAAPGAAAAVPAAGGDPHAGQDIPRPMAPAVDLANIKVAKAPGASGRTVAEVWAQRAALKDKPIAVRGKVVKVTSGVLGRTWLHLRDGTGTSAAQDDDLVVTTTAEVKVNDEVIAEGTVRTDKDLGSGYTYKVLLEDAQLKP